MKTTWTMGVTVFLIPAVCMAPGCNGVKNKNRQANKTADLVLKLLAAEKTDSLYEHYTTEGFRRANSQETLQKLARALKLYLGEPEKLRLLKYELKMTDGNAVGDYVYKVQWAKSDGTLTLKLQWKNGAWKIQTLDIQSSALKDGRQKPVNNTETIQI